MTLYIYRLLSAYQSTIALRSSGQYRLVVPTTLNWTVLASSAFQNYAPKIWNSLPQHLRDIVQTSGAQRPVNTTNLHCDIIHIFNYRLETVEL